MNNSNSNATGNVSAKTAEPLKGLEAKISEAFQGLISDSNGPANLNQMLTDELKARPYEAIATFIGIGFALGTTNRDAFKYGAIRLGRLLATRTISQVETKMTAHSNA